MGKSLRSKRMRRNRNVKRQRNDPRVVSALKSALAFEYNDQTEKAHLSMFHDIMNGPPPAVPGLEKGSPLERAHLTEVNVSADRIDDFMVGKLHRLVESATRAITKGAQRTDIVKGGMRKETDQEMVPVEVEKEPQVQRIYDKKTMKDQFGQYPIWMNKRILRSKSHAYQVQKAKDKRKAKKRGLKLVSKPRDVEMQEDSDSDASDM